MTKNKLIWTFALFLTLIISIPIAYAQTFFESPIFFILINSLIVGVILFVLQSSLMHGKSDKEKTSVWVAIIVASLLIGWFFGSQGFIWNHPVFARFFSITVIVNTLIIAIVAYFALGLLPIAKNITSPEGQTGKGILIFLGSLVWAIGIQNSYGSIFIWQAYSYFISYFIGPEGILNPYPPQYRLLVLTGSAVLLGFFFENFLIKGGNKTVNYALAVILAMNMASSGVRIQSVIILGEIIFTITLERALEASIKTGWLRWIFAGGLVGWASAAMTYGTQYQGFLATLLGPLVSTFIGGAPGKPTEWGWWGKTLLLVLVVMAILGGGLFAITRSQGIRQRAKEAAGIIWTRIWNGMKESTKSGILSRIGWLRDREYRWRIPPGRELPVFVKNRLLLFILLDQCLRLDIFHAKRSFMFYNYREPSAKVLQDYVKDVPNIKVLQEGLRRYRSSPESGKEGWSFVSSRIAEATSNLTKLLRKMLVDQDLKDAEGKSLRSSVPDFGARRVYADGLGQAIGGLRGVIDTHYDEFKKRLEIYKAHNALKFYKLKTYDMYNLSGKYTHSFKVVPAGTRVERDGVIETLTRPTEVDLYGYVIDDLNQQLDKFGSPTVKPRRVIKEDRTKITDYDNVHEMLTWMAQDWDGFVRDFRSGEFHEKTRNAEDYIREFANKNFDDNRIERMGKGTAFDLGALANPGLFMYWGRKRLQDTPSDIFKDANPFPTISSLGIAKYIDNLIRIKMISYEEAKEFMRVYPKDIEGLSELRNWINKEYIIGLLTETSEEVRQG